MAETLTDTSWFEGYAPHLVPRGLSPKEKKLEIKQIREDLATVPKDCVNLKKLYKAQIVVLQSGSAPVQKEQV